MNVGEIIGASVSEELGNVREVAVERSRRHVFMRADERFIPEKARGKSYTNLGTRMISGRMLISKPVLNPTQDVLDKNDYFAAAFHVRCLQWDNVEGARHLKKVVYWPDIVLKTHHFEPVEEGKGCSGCGRDYFSADMMARGSGSVAICDCGKRVPVRVVTNNLNNLLGGDEEAQELMAAAALPSMYAEDVQILYESRVAPEGKYHTRANDSVGADLMAGLRQCRQVAVALPIAKRYELLVVDAVIRSGQFNGSFWIPEEAKTLFGMSINLQEFISKCSLRRCW